MDFDTSQGNLVIPVVTLAAGLEVAREIAAALEEAGHHSQVIHDPSALIDLPIWRSADIVVTILVPVGEAEMNAAPKLRAVVSPLLGYDWIDAEAATARTIAVVNGEVEENRQSLAEATIMLMLALLYQLPQTQDMLRGGGDARPPERHLLKGKTVGVIGFGGIARGVLARLQGWGCRLLVHSRSPAQDAFNATFVGLESLLADSDIVLVLTNLDQHTYQLLDAARLRLMKPSALLVNTARGAIIDESALVEALREKRLAGAALDVFETEPLPADSPLRDLPNVILTPHCAGHTAEARAAVPGCTVRNVLTLADWLLPESCRNPLVAVGWKEKWAVDRTA